MANKQVKYGALLSYILIVLNSIYGLVIMPFVLGTIGESEYGVYKTIGSLASSVSIMEFGLGGTMQKYIAQFRAQKDEKRVYNFSAMCLIISSVLAMAMAIVGIFLFFAIDAAYSSTFTSLELVRAKQIYVVLITYVVLHMFENALFGIISGYNRFIFTNSVKLLTLLLKVITLVTILPIFKNSLAIVFTMLFLELIIIFSEIIYIKFYLKHKIKLYKWDKGLFRETFVYTFLLFVQSIVIQFNGNVDNIVIGAVLGTSAVTIYSFAIQIFNMYEQCATAVSGVILPTVTNSVYVGATPSELENMVIKFGRAQWAVLGAVLGGLICLGKEFYLLWLGEAFLDCYYLTIILAIPVSFPLIVNACLAILKARNLLFVRTIILSCSAIINVVLTIVGTRLWGYYAAAAGTAVSTIVGSVILLNVYYHVKLKMNMIRVYWKIFQNITLCILVPVVLCFILNPFLNGSWLAFFAKAGLFVVVFAVLMLVVGLSKEEKNSILARRRL